MCDRLVAAGVTSILNFAPLVLNVPEGVDVRKVDLSIELQILAFHAQRRNAERFGQALFQKADNCINGRARLRFRDAGAFCDLFDEFIHPYDLRVRSWSARKFCSSL